MSDLRYIVEDRGFTEEEMVNNVSKVVEDINNSTKKVKQNLIHFRIQILGVILSYFLGYQWFIPALFGLASFIFLSRSAYFYGKRKDRISDYWIIVMKYKERGILNKENLYKIEKFEIEELAGDK